MPFLKCITMVAFSNVNWVCPHVTVATKLGIRLSSPVHFKNKTQTQRSKMSSQGYLTELWQS